MNKKLAIGGIVLLLVIGGGLFLLLGPTVPKSDLGESDTIPTQWSQAGDYEIKEVPGPPSPNASAGQSQQTVVTNEKAGFSFKVPAGWRVEDEGDGIEYFLNLLHPSAKFDENNFLIGGCFINVETMYQPDEVIYISTLMKDLADNSSLSDNRKVITLGERLALQTSLVSFINSDNPDVMNKVRDTVRVEIPIHEQAVVAFDLIMKKDFKTECSSFFDRFLSQVSFD